MQQLDLKELLEIAIDAAVEGGREIMNIYEKDFSVEYKNDESPITLADKNAHKVITQLLVENNFPILSEEGEDIPYAERKDWTAFWMIDPLDGTKEFINRNGEFTVNIALIHNHFPVLGVIYVPVKNQLYCGSVEWGSYYMDNYDPKMEVEEFLATAEPLPNVQPKLPFKIVASRSHLNKETEKFIEKCKKEHSETEIVTMGSSLKICLVAAGKAHVYPRFGPTMEWDTAAGHAIALGAKKSIIDQTTNEEMRYNKKDLLNNWFVVE